MSRLKPRPAKSVLHDPHPWHALERISPAGERPVVNGCFLCGEIGLPSEAVFEECENPLGYYQEGAVLAAITGERAYDLL